MKKMNLTLKCVLVMVVISFISVALLAVANVFLVPATSSGLDDKVIAELRKFCPADSYEDLTSDYQEKIDNFNGGNGTDTNKVNGVYRANGGSSDGNLIIEAEAAGYDGGIVTMLTSFRGDEITGIGVRNYDPKNSYWKSHIEPNWENIKNYFIGKSGTDLGNANSFKLETGSTAARTNNAILTSVTLAAGLNQELGGAAPQPTEVTDENLLTKLRSMTDEEATFTQYPYKVGGEINSVYVSNDKEVIIDAVASEGTFGGCNLLVMVDITNKTVIKITPLRMDYEVYEEDGVVYNASGLDNATVLTKHFAGKTVEEIDSMEKYLSPSTGATESNTGLKKCVKNALNNIDGFLASEWGTEVNENE